MLPDPHPPERADLERALAGRACPEPSGGLRERVLAAVAAEPPPRDRASRWWPFAWRAAAALVVIGNLVLTAGNSLRYSRLAGQARARAAPQESGDQLREWTAHALTRLTPGPDVGALGRRLLEQMEEIPWDMP